MGFYGGFMRGLYILGVIALSYIVFTKAQTEGDAGYDYDDAYVYSYEDEPQTEGDVGYDYPDVYDDIYDETEDDMLGLEPTFDVTILNVTVVAGQTAVLPCSIDNLSKHKVTWSKISEADESLELTLTLGDRRVVDDARFNIIRPYIKEWNLQITDVDWADQGHYLCTINTTPVKSKKVVLYVKVPPRIIDEQSSNDVTIQENDTVSLTCKVAGVPKPTVTWRRIPALPTANERKERIGLTGEVLVLENVTRYCDDLYECVADNGVNPRVLRQIKVTVQFPPEIELLNNHIIQSIGKETMMDCKVTAFPHATIYWEKSGDKITTKPGKFDIEVFDDQTNVKTLSLRIKQIEEKDYGVYTCKASNGLGQASGKMVLRHKVGHSTTSGIPRIIYHSTEESENSETPKQSFIPEMPRGPVTRPPETRPIAGGLTNNGQEKLSISITSLWILAYTAVVPQMLLLHT